jgi:hypothetical protein
MIMFVLLIEDVDLSADATQTTLSGPSGLSDSASVFVARQCSARVDESPDLRQEVISRPTLPPGRMPGPKQGSRDGIEFDRANPRFRLNKPTSKTVPNQVNLT